MPGLVSPFQEFKGSPMWSLLCLHSLPFRNEMGVDEKVPSPKELMVSTTVLGI